MADLDGVGHQGLAAVKAVQDNLRGGHDNLGVLEEDASLLDELAAIAAQQCFGGLVHAILAGWRVVELPVSYVKIVNRGEHHGQGGCWLLLQRLC